MLNDVAEITQQALSDVYEFTIRSNNNVIIFGPSGIGKTEMAIQSSIDSKYNYHYINLSTLEAVDLVGLPKISNDVTTYAPPDFLPIADKNSKESILIVDEIDKAGDDIQNPMLELFQFRSINGRKLNIKSIIATGNLPNERAKSRIISHALANRCQIFKIGCDFEHWRKWAVTNNINPLIVGFLNQRSDLLLKPNGSGDPTAYCNPSPRAWTMAARDIDAFNSYVEKDPEYYALTNIEQDPVVDFQFTLVAGRVGLKAAIEFKIWLKHYRFLGSDIDALVNSGIFPLEKKLSMDRIMIIGFAAINEINKTCVNGDSKKISNVVNNVCKWLNSDQVTADQCFAIVKSTLTHDLVEKRDLLAYSEFEKVFDKIGDSLDLL